MHWILRSPDFPFDLGVLGIPEFGTEFGYEHAEGYKADHGCRIAAHQQAWSHGTEVWLGNAADLLAP